VYGWLFSLLMLVGLLFSSGIAQEVHAAPMDSGLPYLTVGGGSENPPLQFYDVLNRNLFVQHDPKIYLVFWGPNWNSDTGTVSTIANTFKALAGSEYNNILSQYWDSTGGYFTNKVTLMDDPPLIDASTPPSNLDIGFETSFGVWDNAQIRHEADHVIQQQGWNVDQNTQIIVFPQKGSTYNHGNNFCGVHSYDSTAASPYAYGLVQYGDQTSGCNFVNDTASNIAWTGVHEYTEMVTDPQIHANPTLSGSPWFTAGSTGWHTVDGNQSTPQEIADLCSGYYPTNNSSIPYYYANGVPLPYLWSNIANGCVMSQGQEFASPDYTAPFHGIHTVQGAILTHYYAFGADTGGLGQPVSEETPIAGGRVSYFANNGCGPVSAIYWSPATGANTVYGCIMARYQDLGEANSFLGFPVTDETDAPGGGRVNYFTGTSWGSYCTAFGGSAPYSNSNAAIYWNGNDALAVKGCIYNYYQDVAGGPAGSMGLGLPISEETPLNGGVIETFAGSSCGSSTGSAIYDSNGTGVHAMKGCIYYYYNTYYNGTSGMGFPTSDELSMGGGHAQHFSNGRYLYDGPGTGIHQVIGAILGQYINLGEANSFLGFPVSDETSTPGGTGRVSYFGGTTWGSHCGSAGPYNSYGAIYWSGASGAWEVHGCLYDAYIHRFGGPDGRLGFPVENQENPSGGGHLQYFQNGYLQDDVNGNITMHIICPPAC